jgi:uncharacterized protein (TIGR00725 family)
MKISAFGSSKGAAGEAMYDAMAEAGRLLAQAGHIVAGGGFSGAGMEAPCRGARQAGGETIGYTFGGWEANKYLMAEIDCRYEFIKPQSETPLAVQFGVRLGLLLEADAYIIGAGGSEGTMVELMAIIASHRFGKAKNTAILRPIEVSGWDEQMLDQLQAWGVLPATVRQGIKICSSPEEAVDWATSM